MSGQHDRGKKHAFLYSGDRGGCGLDLYIYKRLMNSPDKKAFFGHISPQRGSFGGKQ